MALGPGSQQGGSFLSASSPERNSDHAGCYSREWTGGQLHECVFGGTAWLKVIRHLAKEVIIQLRPARQVQGSQAQGSGELSKPED